MEVGWGRQGGVASADVGVAWRPLYLLDIYISDTGFILLGQLKFLDRPRYKLVAAEEQGARGKWRRVGSVRGSGSGGAVRVSRIQGRANQ